MNTSTGTEPVAWLRELTEPDLQPPTLGNHRSQRHNHNHPQAIPAQQQTVIDAITAINTGH